MLDIYFSLKTLETLIEPFNNPLFDQNLNIIKPLNIDFF